MTKKDYIAIAAILKKHTLERFVRQDLTPLVLMHDDLFQDLCNLFKSDNPNFDRVKFLKACGYYK